MYGSACIQRIVVARGCSSGGRKLGVGALVSVHGCTTIGTRLLVIGAVGRGVRAVGSEDAQAFILCCGS